MTQRRSPQTVFQSPFWLRASAFGAMVLLSIAASYFSVKEGVSLRSVGFAMAAGFGVYGFVNALVAKISLLDDALVVSSVLRKQRYERRTLESVTWEAGSGVALRRTDGSWLKLQTLGHNSQS